MINNNLRADLISEIKGLEGFFHDLPRDVRDRYGLEDEPLTVCFGPDADYVFVNQNGVNVFRADSTLNADDISDVVENFIMIHGVNIAPNVEPDSNKFVEIRFNHANALSVCEHHDSANALIENFAYDMGWHAFGISSHSHMSMTQHDRDCFRSGQIGNYSDLFKNTVAQTLTLQERFPAFFIRPFRAEQPKKGAGYLGPEVVAFDSKAAAASVRGRHFTGPARTVESRINPYDPYQMMYLNMHAGRLALERQSLDVSASAKRVLGLNEIFWQDGGWDISVPDVNTKVRRGAGGYLDMLEETAQNLREYPDVFPKHISDGMMRTSIAGYERFLEDKPGAADRVADVPDFDRRLWGLKQQFPEPEEPKIGAEYAV